jgi:MFS family permease
VTLAGERNRADVALEAPAVLRYGGMTMVAIIFANFLQLGELQSFAQAAESIRHSLHVTDFQLGLLSFLTGVVGALGALPVGALCSRRARTRVLAGMFTIWAALMIVLGLSQHLALSLFGLRAGMSAFLVFAGVKLVVSLTEATDPAAYPLISDYWPVERRAAKVSIFNAGGAAGSLLGLAAGGVLVDRYGWPWAFYIWAPVGLIGAAVMMTRREPVRGAQDAAFRDELVTLSEEAKLEELKAEEALAGRRAAAPGAAAPPVLDESAPAAALLVDALSWSVFRELWRLRTWRVTAIGFGVAQMLTIALQFWGASYFKRTFGLTGTEVAGLAPLIGSGAFLGLLGGGFVADRLLRRGIVRARVYVSSAGFLAAFGAMALAFTTRSLAVAAPVLFVGTLCAALPIGPVWALQLDVTPIRLRPQAMAVSDLLQLVNTLGYLVVGGLSELVGSLRGALLLTAPFCAVGGLLILVLGSRTYVADVAMVVADAEQQLAARRPLGS